MCGVGAGMKARGDHDEAAGTVRKFIQFMWGVVCGQMLKGAVWVGSAITMGPVGITVVHKRAAIVGLILGIGFNAIEMGSCSVFGDVYKIYF
ncbi:hypothetical protein V6N13_053382 [Hibiscus sabdariffa]